MNSGWFKVLLAAFFEVLWVIGLNLPTSFWTLAGTLLCYLTSFYFLVAASDNLPVGTVYAVFVGLGTAGAVLAEYLLFQEELGLAKILLILLLLVGIIGLKMVTEDSPEETQEGGQK